MSRLFIDILYIAAIVIVRTINSQKKVKLLTNLFFFNSTKGNNNLGLLALQNVNCGLDGFIMNFALEINDAIQSQRYVYDCCQPQGSSLVNCQNLETNRNDDGNYNPLFLDRHNVRCHGQR